MGRLLRALGEAACRSDSSEYEEHIPQIIAEADPVILTPDLQQKLAPLLPLVRILDFVMIKIDQN